MKTLRNLLFACVAAATLLMPIAGQSVVEAGPQPGNPQGQHRIYWVYYRASVNSSWVNYGGYYQQSRAVQAVNYFRARGYDAFYR